MTAQGLLPIHHQASELIMPGMRPLHLPPSGLPSRLRRGIITPATLGGNMPEISLYQHDVACRAIVKGGIETQMLGVERGGLRADNGGLGEHGRQHRAIVDIGGRGHHTQRHPASVHQQMVFIAGLAAVGGIGAGLFFPPAVPGHRFHRLLATASQSPSPGRRDGDSAPRAVQRFLRLSTPQSDHRRFAKGQRLGGGAPATDSPSTTRRAWRLAAGDQRPAYAHLWPGRVARGSPVPILPTSHPELAAALSWRHFICILGLQTSSKPIIDEIDAALADYYGFSKEELDFIINYDIKYRMG